jgi:UDP-N-acetylglucosamine 2-epimerase
MLPEEFLRLLCNSNCIVGNSSVAIRECAFLGVPAVNIGSRQQGRERGKNVIDVGYDRAAITSAIRQHLASGHTEGEKIYGDGTAGQQIAEVLATAKLSVEKRLAY